jgi:methylthioribose-1-phosphate isomerase
MGAYTLQANEVVLYKGTALVNNSKQSSELVLTNLRFLIITRTKKLLAKEVVDVKTYSQENVKVYNGVPQIKQNKNMVTIYFSDTVVTLEYDSIVAPIKLVSEMTKLVSGKTSIERGADKMMGVVDLVDNTLGIDSVNAIKGIVKNGVGGTLFFGIGDKQNAATKQSPVVQAIDIAKELMGSSKPTADNPKVAVESSLSVDRQVKAVKELKELLDAGILTQEEFDAKKREILHL